MAISSGLYSHILPSLCVEPGQRGGMGKWLGQGSFTPTIGSDGNLNLQVDDYAVVLPFLSAEYERFALSAAQTFELAATKTSGDLSQSSWRLLIGYYGAFYSAHALLRSIGVVESFLSATVANRINELINIHGINVDPLASGPKTIRVKLADRGSRVVLSFHSPATGKGVHDAFWRNFCNGLNSLAVESLESGAPDARLFLSEVEEISSLVRTGDALSNSWLAEIRNAINYRHEYDSWFPQSKNSDAKAAENSIRNTSSGLMRLDFDRSKQSLISFAATCNYISVSSLEVAEFVSTRSTKGGTFGQRWRKLKGITSNI